MKVTYKETKELIDHETGVIKKEEKTTKSTLPSEPDFIKVYLQDICDLNQIPRASNKILNELFKYTTYGNRIVINSGIKREISKGLKMGYQTVSNTLNLLSKKGIIKRQDTGIYFLNPFLFGKGDWNTIQNLRLKINYDFINKKKTMEVETTNSLEPEENNATKAELKEKPKTTKTEKKQKETASYSTNPF